MTPELPQFARPGDAITAADWNKLIKAVRPQLTPGSYQNGSFYVQKPPKRPKAAVLGGAATTDTGAFFARVVTEISPATGFDDASHGSGEAVQVDNDGSDLGPTFAVYTRFGERVLVDTPIYVHYEGESIYLLVPGCGPLPSSGTA